MKVVKKTEISYNFVQIGLKMCKLALAKKLNSVLKLKTGISGLITPLPNTRHFCLILYDLGELEMKARLQNQYKRQFLFIRFLHFPS